MYNEIEIDLKDVTSKRTLFEYQSPVTPRIGEIMAIDVEEHRGLYEVNGVAHNVFKEKSTGRIYSYVTVYLEKKVTPKATESTESARAE